MTTTTGPEAVEAHLDGLPEPRRSQMRHLHEVLLEAMPGVDVRMWDYGGPLIGYGTYAYSNSRGPAGDWFSVGLASRKAYISLFSMALRDGDYLVNAVHDRFPGAKLGRSCLNIGRPDAVDDDAVRDLATETRAWLEGGMRRA